MEEEGKKKEKNAIWSKSVIREIMKMDPLTPPPPPLINTHYAKYMISRVIVKHFENFLTDLYVS